MLTNAESWINVTKQNLDDLKKPDINLQRQVLSVTSNPSKCFLRLELGLVSVKYVIMQKRLMFLQYILKENTASSIRKVFDALKEESRKGDFVYLTNSDRQELEIKHTDDEIANMSKVFWKNIVKDKTKSLAFTELVEENCEKEKTRVIQFNSLEMSNYLAENERTSLSKLKFQIRSQTMDIKTWQPWKYSDKSCVKCEKTDKTMSHFSICSEYTSEKITSWWDIKQNNTERQKEIARLVKKRIKQRKKILNPR